MIGTPESPLVARLYAFIEGSRSGVSDVREASLRWQGIGKLTNSLRRVYVVVNDYEAANAAFFDHFKRQKELFASHPQAEAEGSRDMTPGEIRLMIEGGNVNLVLHLRIETFYVFAKILLDDIPMAIRGFFGQGRGLSMRSHSKLVKELPRYAQEKGLIPPPPSLLTAGGDAERRISEFRDHYVTHEQNLRAIKGTVFDMGSGETRIGVGMLLPKDTDTYRDSEAPPGLLAFIESYVGEVLTYIEANASAPWNRPMGT